MRDQHRPTRPPTNGSNGVRPHGMNARPVPFDEVTEPVDLMALQADDELIDALAAGMRVSAPGRHGYDADDRVVAMLAAWKAEVDAEPIPELVDLDTAMAAVAAGGRPAARPPSGRVRHLVPLAAAAAVVVFVGAGVSLGAQAARPGDVLFPVAKVLYAEQARSAEAVVVVEAANSRARELLAAGDVAGAEEVLAVGQDAVDEVLVEDGKDALAQEIRFLGAKAAETPPGTPADLNTPPSATEVQPTPGTSTSPSGAPGVPPSSEAPPSPTTAPTPSDPGTTPTTEPGTTTEGTPDTTTGTAQGGAGGTTGTAQAGTAGSDATATAGGAR